MKKIFLLASLVGLAFNAQAQYLKSPNQHYDLSLSSNGQNHLFAVSAAHLHPLGKKQKFSLGYGLRFNLNAGSKSDFWTAPAKLTTGNSGPQVLFQENLFQNFDTIQTAYLVGSLNLSIHLNYRFNSRWQAEFNIDALGFSFGSEVDAEYSSSKRDPSLASTQKAKPTVLNALLISDNDIGSLNSELFVGYTFNPRLTLKAGASFAFTEYTTTNKLFLDNQRFRNKSLMGLLAIRFTPFAN